MVDQNFSIDRTKSPKPPKQLFERIITRLKMEKKLAVSRRRMLYFVFILAGTFAGFIVTCAALQNILVQSELLKILSLVFSDPKVVLANWQDFGLFVLESLPAISLAIFFVALFVLLGSLKYAVKYLAQMLSWSKKIKQTHVSR